MADSYLNDEVVAAVASAIEQRAAAAGTLEAIAERKDLEPVTAAVLDAAFPGRAEKDRKVTIPRWVHVGRVDAIVREAPGSDRMSALIELKWCGPAHDILFEGISDLLKMALGTTRSDRPRGYLLTGAEMSLWSASRFADLFDEADHNPVELCARRLPDKKRTLAWDEAIRGAYGHYPDAVPAGIATRVVGRASIGSWELRAVDVIVTDTKLIAVDGGWPYGDRPADAEHPPLRD